jgi:hypothetical protein
MQLDCAWIFAIARGVDLAARAVSPQVFTEAITVCVVFPQEKPLP